MKKVIIAFLFVAAATFAQDDSEWSEFDYQHAGLTQTEFQNVKESGMSKDKLLHLLEIGVRPSEYLKEPWNDLGVSESKWLSEREGGMENADIDRTYKNKGGDQSLAYLSFLLPSLYQWNADETAMAVAIDICEAAAIGLTVFLANDGSEGNKWVYGILGIAAVHIWSGADAILSTQWDSNPDARKFSWGIIPTGKNAFVASASFRF